MPVYVDRSRLAADTPQELWRAAEQLKLPDDSLMDVYYPISPRNRAIVLTSGAIELSTREMDQKMGSIRQFGTGNPWDIVR